MVARQTQRSNIIAYPGYCHVHRMIRPEDVVAMLDEHPDIELLLHPECGCVSSCMAKALDGGPSRRAHLFFVDRRHASPHREFSAKEFAVGTELGILHGLRKQHPERTFYPVNPDAVCAFMKTITLDRIIASLEELTPQVRVPSDIAVRARRSTACCNSPTAHFEIGAI